jgi:hypothetical protein
MECRISLKMVSPQQPRQAPNTSRTQQLSWGYSSYGTAPASFSAPPIQKKIALPLPKNQVLMSVIEAAQMSGLDPEDEDGLVLHGIRAIASSAGTYLVKEERGLKVLDPTESKSSLGGVDENETKMLHYGDKVQILNFENFTATLPRGAGYVNVDNNLQLVKGKQQVPVLKALTIDLSGYSG